MIESVILLALSATFILLLITKLGWREKGQIYGPKLISKMFNCDFCISFWICFVPLSSFIYFWGWRLDCTILSHLRKSHCKTINMKTIEIGKYKVELYDSIDELPIKRFHKFNKYLLVDAGVGSDLNDINDKIGRIMRFVELSDKINANMELENLRQALYLVSQGTNVRHLALMVLVKVSMGRKSRIYPTKAFEPLRRFLKINL